MEFLQNDEINISSNLIKIPGNKKLLIKSLSNVLNKIINELKMSENKSIRMLDMRERLYIIYKILNNNNSKNVDKLYLNTLNNLDDEKNMSILFFKKIKKNIVLKLNDLNNIIKLNQYYTI